MTPLGKQCGLCEFCSPLKPCFKEVGAGGKVSKPLSNNAWVVYIYISLQTLHDLVEQLDLEGGEQSDGGHTGWGSVCERFKNMMVKEAKAEHLGQPNDSSQPVTIGARWPR